MDSIMMKIRFLPANAPVMGVSAASFGWDA